MGRRPSVCVRRFAKAEPPWMPNRTIGAVTVDLRVFYPPTSEGIDIALALLADTYAEATEELQARRAPGSDAGGFLSRPQSRLPGERNK